MKEDNAGYMPEDQKHCAGAEKTSPTQPTVSGESLLSRRIFIGRLGKIAALGSFAHFKLLGGKAFAANDQCCYGASGDVCDPANSNADDCPGGGAASVDNCTIADPAGQDECYSGIDPDDVCPPGGGPGAGGDECYGGGPTTGGAEQDNCDNGRGDACTSPGASFPGGGGHDNCKANEEGNVTDMCDATNADFCNWVPPNFSDDTCPSGNNVGFGQNGADDTCSGDFRSSDACYDGSATQDLCAGDSSGDICMGMVGNEQTDECPSYKPPEDECPAGCSSSEDRCDPYASNPD